MYYDANGADYISTSSFAIPNTGVLTINAWMKSAFSAVVYHSVMGSGTQISTVSHLILQRGLNNNTLNYYYANGVTTAVSGVGNFFLDLDNQ